MMVQHLKIRGLYYIFVGVFIHHKAKRVIDILVIVNKLIYKQYTFFYKTTIILPELQFS